MKEKIKALPPKVRDLVCAVYVIGSTVFCIAGMWFIWGCLYVLL